MRSAATIGAIRFVSLLLGGIFAGFLVTVLVLELTLRDYGPQIYTQVRHVELVRLDDLASATLLPALIATAALVALTARVRERRFWLVVAALGLLVVAFLTSVTVNLPINSDQLDWSVQAPPADWDGDRDRWQVAHVVRTAAAVLAFGCLTVAALLGPASARR